MQIIKKRDIKKSVQIITEVLKKGGLVIMPTETLYGAFVDATNAKAVKKLTLFKNRPFGKPYSVAVLNQKMADRYVSLNKTAKNLYKTFLPGPVTIISKGKHKVSPGVESETGSLGIRIPDYQLVLKVIKLLEKPITATSANASYQRRPYNISDILENLSEKQKKLIDLIVDAGELPKNEPSTVIDTTMDDPVVLRQGDIKFRKKDEVFSISEEATQNIAKEIWQKFEKYVGQRAVVFALEGQMGAGKTVFTKGLAKAMGIKEEVVSPTYDLMLEYETPATRRPQPTTHNSLTHIDTWRMESGKELVELGFGKKINDKSVIAIEWADKVADEIRKRSEEAVIIWVNIRYGKKENERLISWGVI